MESTKYTINENNKAFYRDFVNTVQIRLDNHKGEIKQLIEHERSEIKVMFDSQTATIEKMQNSQLEKLAKEITITRKTILWFGVCISILCLLILVVKFVVQ